VDLYPAIDVRGGRCVRLRLGDFADETVYSDDPVAVAESFALAGARWIHVVDLDAARTGEPVNRPVVRRICEAAAPAGVRVQVGGGVRDEAAAAALAEVGAARVVMGTAVVERPDLVAAVAARQAVAIGLDARGSEIAVRGWEASTGVRLLDVLASFSDAGVEAVVVTEIARDGTLEGPDLAGLASVLGNTELPVIASGGVGSLDDVVALRDLRDPASGDRRLAGAIVGRALYEGRVELPAALSALA
jgi:phosphoribosylformimino-5-aminoimidazole carboxamide ribotide isomerase